MNVEAKILNKILSAESNNILKRSWIINKWALSQGCKDSSIFTNQSMRYTPLTNWKIKTIWLSQCMKLLSRVQLLATPWTAAYQAPLSMGFSRQEYWSGLPLPSPGTAIWPSNPTAGHTHQGSQNWKRHMYPSVHHSTVFIIARTWKQLRCPSADKWIRKL